MPVLQTVQMLGLIGMGSYAFSRLVTGSRIVSYQRSRLLAVPVSAMPAMPRGYRVVALSLEALAQEALAGHAIDVGPDVQAKRFKSGATCLAAYNDREVLVGVMWLAAGAYDEDDTHVRYLLADNAGWDTGLWIVPAYRMSRALSALWAGAAEWLRARGLAWSVSKIADYNWRSIHAHRRMQPVFLGHFTVVRFGSWQITTRGRPVLARVSLLRRTCISIDVEHPIARMPAPRAS